MSANYAPIFDEPWIESYMTRMPTISGTETRGIGIGRSSASEGSIKRRFNTLAEEWRKRTAHHSRVSRIIRDTAYQQIIAMGKDALPYIFASLRQRTEHWFFALESITDENPIPYDFEGSVTEAASFWLDWADAHGYGA